MADARVKSIIFDEDKHKYTYDGRELFGVTGSIGKLMGKEFPDTDIVKLKTIYGSDVHKEVENYIKHNGVISTNAGKWLLAQLLRVAVDDTESGVVKYDLESEVMVSDFVATASKIDIVQHLRNGVRLYDIKTTSHFDREYCSLQLSVYKRLYEQCYDEKVLGLYVLGTQSQRMFHILEQSKEKVDLILDMNKGKLCK